MLNMRHCLCMFIFAYESEHWYTENYIGNDTLSNELWGIRSFRILIPFIEEHIPVDVSVSDKELYCLYIAVKYLSNVSSSCD